MSTAPARRAPRIVFNSDGDIHFRGLRSAGDMAGFYRGIDELAGTQVDCYCYCISAGGDTYRHPSEVAPLLGADLETLDGVPDYLRRDIENTRALIEEVLTRYDVDGFELDFLRGAYYFRTDERRSGMPLMTGFVREVRALVDRAGEGKGRPLTLAIRVGRDVAECEGCGLDVRTWAAEGLADLLGAGPAEQALHRDGGRLGERRGGSRGRAGCGRRGVADAASGAAARCGRCGRVPPLDR